MWKRSGGCTISPTGATTRGPETRTSPKTKKYKFRRPRAIMRRTRQLPLSDKVSVAAGLLVYSAYSFVAPWLFFAGIDNGAVGGCDVQVLFVLAPVSVYNPSFRIFLRVAACSSVVWGATLTILAYTLLLLGIVDRAREAPAAGLFNRKGKKTEKSMDASGHPPEHDLGPPLTPTRPAGDVAAAGPSTAPSPRTLTFAPPDDPVILPPSRRKTHEHSADRHPGTTSYRQEVGVSRIAWAVFLTVLLAETIAIVEATIRVNRIEMVRQPMAGTAELIAFFAGALVLLLVCWTCFVGRFGMWGRMARRPSSRTGGQDMQQAGGDAAPGFMVHRQSTVVVGAPAIPSPRPVRQASLASIMSGENPNRRLYAQPGAQRSVSRFKEEI